MNDREYARLRETETPATAQTSNTQPDQQDFNTSTQQKKVGQKNSQVKAEEEDKQEPRPQKEDAVSKFECNICLDVANEPVVSKCGHLYCWVCIYQWMNQPRETLLCPVCKSGISTEGLTPIYTRGNTEDPRKKSNQEVPKRPGGQRSGPVPNQNYSQGGNSLFGNRQSGFVMGLGIFPALFSLNFTWDDIFGSNNLSGQGGGHNASNNEETREQQLHRLLLVFMFFIFMSFVFFGGDVFLTF